MISLLTRLAALLLLAAFAITPGRAEPVMKVTLLGTATPTPRPDRFGMSTLVEAGGQKLVFDAGRGATIRLWQLKVPIGRIDALFITHYHSDHVSGIPDLWLTGWLPTPFGRRTTPFRVIGPVGAKDMMDGLQKAYALDIKIRMEDEKLPLQGIAVDVQEFEQDGVVYEKDGVRLIAFTVDHGVAIKPAVGYRIEYQGHAVVLSGDTRYSENVIKYGTDADLLIHEVGSARPELLAFPFAQRIMAHHTSPHDAGRVFAQAKPKLAVYAHISMLSGEGIAEPTFADMLAETRQTYDGPLEIGEDLMSFEIGDTVTMHRFKP